MYRDGTEPQFPGSSDTFPNSQTVGTYPGTSPSKFAVHTMFRSVSDTCLPGYPGTRNEIKTRRLHSSGCVPKYSQI
eukprot:2281135-Rhodomonas_salina.2